MVIVYQNQSYYMSNTLNIQPYHNKLLRQEIPTIITTAKGYFILGSTIIHKLHSLFEH